MIRLEKVIRADGHNDQGGSLSSEGESELFIAPGILNELPVVIDKTNAKFVAGYTNSVIEKNMTEEKFADCLDRVG